MLPPFLHSFIYAISLVTLIICTLLLTNHILKLYTNSLRSEATIIADIKSLFPSPLSYLVHIR